MHTLTQCKGLHCRCIQKDCPNYHFHDCELNNNAKRIDMETPKIKSVEEVVLQFHMAGDFEPSEPVKTDYEVKELLTQDRASLHTSLVAAIEGKNFELNIDEYLPKVKAWKGGYDVPFDDGYAQGKKDTLTIINSIFKE